MTEQIEYRVVWQMKTEKRYTEGPFPSYAMAASFRTSLLSPHCRAKRIESCTVTRSKWKKVTS